MDLSRQCARAARLCAVAWLAACGSERSAQHGAQAPAPRDSLLSPVVPMDVVPGSDSTLQQLQHDFDVYSWKSFVALNWPVGANGEADTTQTIGAGGDGATVWETYKDSYAVFQPGGAPPAPWGSPPVYPPACQNVGAQAGTPVFRMVAKAPQDVLSLMSEPFETGPLIDQDSQYVRYSVHLNRDAFEYVVANNLYSAEGQDSASNIRFPVDTVASGDTITGAIVIKTAWKVMGPNDQTGRFHTAQVLVYTDSTVVPSVTQPTCELKTMGLVGFHFAHKTQSAPQWLWSTFEQVDNVQVPQGSGLRPSFNNPACTGCPVNQPPIPPWNPAVNGPPSQITRVLPIDSATMALNAEWQARLRAVSDSSVWQYYQLVSTQWPTNPAQTGGNPAPQFLANTTLETYVQGQVPNVSSSCIGCHANATTVQGRFSDFSYLLELAQSASSASQARRR